MSQSIQSLLTVTQRPFNAETPLAELNLPVTPTRLFFVRSNFDIPLLDAATWHVQVGGLCNRPRPFSLEQLRSFPQREVHVTMECAGNGRALMQPQPGGTPWQLGAASSGVFGGIALRHVLEECGLDDEAVELVFTGADSGRIDNGSQVQFTRSLPRARALHPDTLLVWSMNDAPLMPEHGHPLRLLVPGWYGVASVKWLTRITAVAEPYEGHFQTDRYVYRGQDRVADETPVTLMQVRALITHPQDGTTVDEVRRVRGVAWSGFGRIAGVEVSLDGGRTWGTARVKASRSPYAAASWRFDCGELHADEYEILARATDRAGNVQPVEPVWNELGYANNVVQRVRVRISGTL